MTEEVITLLLIGALVLAAIMIIVVIAKLRERHIRRNELIEETVDLCDDMTHKSWTKSPIVYIGGKEPNSTLIEEAPMPPKTPKGPKKVTITEAIPHERKNNTGPNPVTKKKSGIAIAEVEEGKRVIGAGVHVTEAEAPEVTKVKVDPAPAVHINESYPVTPMDMKSPGFVITEVEGTPPESGVIRKPKRPAAERKTAINVSERYADDATRLVDKSGNDYVVTTTTAKRNSPARIVMSNIEGDRARRGVNIAVVEEYVGKTAPQRADAKANVVSATPGVTLYPARKSEPRAVARETAVAPSKSARPVVASAPVAPKAEAKVDLTKETPGVKLYPTRKSEVASAAVRPVAASTNEAVSAGPGVKLYPTRKGESEKAATKPAVAVAQSARPAMAPAPVAPKAETRVDLAKETPGVKLYPTRKSEPEKAATKPVVAVAQSARPAAAPAPVAPASVAPKAETKVDLTKATPGVTLYPVRKSEPAKVGAVSVTEKNAPVIPVVAPVVATSEPKEEIRVDTAMVTPVVIGAAPVAPAVETRAARIVVSETAISTAKSAAAPVAKAQTKVETSKATPVLINLADFTDSAEPKAATGVSVVETAVSPKHSATVVAPKPETRVDTAKATPSVISVVSSPKAEAGAERIVVSETVVPTAKNIAAPAIKAEARIETHTATPAIINIADLTENVAPKKVSGVSVVETAATPKPSVAVATPKAEVKVDTAKATPAVISVVSAPKKAEAGADRIVVSETAVPVAKNIAAPVAKPESKVDTAKAEPILISIADLTDNVAPKKVSSVSVVETAVSPKSSVASVAPKAETKVDTAKAAPSVISIVSSPKTETVADRIVVSETAVPVAKNIAAPVAKADAKVDTAKAEPILIKIEDLADKEEPKKISGVSVVETAASPKPAVTVATPKADSKVDTAKAAPTVISVVSAPKADTGAERIVVSETAVPVAKNIAAPAVKADAKVETRKANPIIISISDMLGTAKAEKSVGVTVTETAATPATEGKKERVVVSETPQGHKVIITPAPTAVEAEPKVDRANLIVIGDEESVKTEEPAKTKASGVVTVTETAKEPEKAKVDVVSVPEKATQVTVTETEDKKPTAEEPKTEVAEEPVEQKTPEIAEMHPVNNEDEEIVFTETVPEPAEEPVVEEPAEEEEEEPIAPIAPVDEEAEEEPVAEEPAEEPVAEEEAPEEAPIDGTE